MPREKRVFVVQIDHPGAEGQFQTWDGIDWFYFTMHPTKELAQEQIDQVINEQWYRDCDEDNFRIVNMDKFTALHKVQ